MSTMAIAATSPVNAFTFNLQIFLREARYEFVRLSRTRSFALSVIGFPVAFYLFFGLILNRAEHIGSLSVAKYMLAGYGVFGMVGASLFGVGVALSSELNAGWLELKRASPMPPLAYLLAKCISAMAFGVIIVSILTLMSIAIGHVSVTLLEYARLIALTIVGVVPFACMGMALALFIPANSAPGFTNLIYLPMSFCGGLWVPIMLLPRFMQNFALIMPTYHLGQLALGIFGYTGSGSTIGHWLGLLAFTLVMLGIGAIAFRSREQNS